MKTYNKIIKYLFLVVIFLSLLANLSLSYRYFFYEKINITNKNTSIIIELDNGRYFELNTKLDEFIFDDIAEKPFKDTFEHEVEYLENGLNIGLLSKNYKLQYTHNDLLKNTFIQRQGKNEIIIENEYFISISPEIYMSQLDYSGLFDITNSSENSVSFADKKCNFELKSDDLTFYDYGNHKTILIQSTSKDLKYTLTISCNE